ncbi:MAG: hypothetical protein QW279_10490 [Candidatus Jordarchaeaceae archaeon]
MNSRAIETAKEMQQLDSKAAKWNTSNALRELTSKVIQKGLRQKTNEIK